MSTNTNPKEHPNVGRKIKYTPSILDDDEPTEGVIEKFVPAGSFFNQPMLIIPEVEHWIPMSDCEFIDD